VVTHPLVGEAGGFSFPPLPYLKLHEDLLKYGESTQTCFF
jgi:hypothetical protein